MVTWARGHLAHDPREPYRLMAVATPLAQYGDGFDLDQIRICARANERSEEAKAAR